MSGRVEKVRVNWVTEVMFIRLVANIFLVCCLGRELKGSRSQLQSTPLNIKFFPEVVGETTGERFLRMRMNCMATVAQCIQPSTRGTYETGWRRWVSFCRWFEVDPYLRVVPKEWVVHDWEVPVDFREMAVVSFMQKLCVDEQLCPGTVNVYLSSVRYVYKMANLDIAFLASEWVAAARTAVTLLYRVDHPIAGRVGLPFTCDMVVHAMTKTLNRDTPEDHVKLTAMKLALTCLLRVSEYIPGSPSADHWLRSQDVAFGMRDGSVVPSWRVSLVVLSDVRSVIVTVRSAKNDVEGEGHRMEFPRVAVDAMHAFDLAADMFSWAVRAQPKYGHPFLSYRGEWRLGYAALSKVIKLVAKELGLDPARYRTHSLRIGGASMMAAAGRPDYEIQKQGRWKSLAFLEYIRLGRASFKAALEAICNPSILTVADVGRMHAGVEV